MISIEGFNGVIAMCIVILLGISVCSSFMSIEVLVSTSINSLEDLYKRC